MLGVKKYVGPIDLSTPFSFQCHIWVFRLLLWNLDQSVKKSPCKRLGVIAL